MRRWRALGVILAGLALVVGVPAVLVATVGWPLPRTFPDLQGVLDDVRARGIGEDVLVRVLAVAAWLAWGHLVASIVGEVHRLVRRRPSRARRGTGALARWLVHGVAVLTSVGSVAPRPALGQPPALVDAAHPELPSVVAGPRDTLRTLAERHLGDLERRREILELNHGRRLPDGTPFTGRLQPGFDVLLPADARTHTVGPGDTLTGIVRSAYGTADPRRVHELVHDVFDANEGTADDGHGHVLADPDLIHPGMVLVLPGLPGAAPVEEPVAVPDDPAPVAPPAAPSPTAAPPATTPPAPTTSPAPTTPPAPTTSPAPTTPPAPTTAAAPTTSPSPDSPSPDGAAPGTRVEVAVQVVSAVGASMVLAGGLGALVGSRARRRLQRAGRGVRLPSPRPAAAPLATELAGRADGGLGVARIDLALRAAAARAVHGAAGRAVRLLAVVHEPDGSLVVHLDRPVTAPLPWTAPDGDHARWVLPAEVPLRDLVADAAGVAPPCPALVTLGTTPEGAEVLADLEAIGRLVVDGPRAHTVLAAVAAQLAVTPFAEGVHVVVAGLDLHEIADEERVHTAPDAASAVRAAARLGGVRPADPLAARVDGGGEPFEPAVVVHPGPVPPHAGAVVTGDGDDPAPWRLRREAGRWRVEPLGRIVRPAGLDDGEAAAVGALLADSREPPEPVAAAVRPVDGPDEPDWELLVRVLGPVDVVDRAERPAPFVRRKALELVVWLAHHRRAPTRAGARAALWEVGVASGTFSNVVSDARRALARLVEPPLGDEWIARTYAERLPIHDRVVLDADLVAAALERSRRLPDAEALGVLTGALALVRGAPFADVRYPWADAEALPGQLTLLVTGTAAELAERALRLGDPVAALEATAAGLGVLPGHEELVGLRMRAHAARGDLAAVRRELDWHERAVLADPWSDGEVAPSLLALRDDLVGPG